MNNLAKEINDLLLNNHTIQEYLNLKKEIDSDKKITSLRNRLDVLRKEICKNKDKNEKNYCKI